MSSRRRTKHEEHEEHQNHERWMVTYADMLTLLMVLFIVMFAMSQVDQKKYNALKNGLADGFGATTSFMKGSESILQDHPGDLSPDIAAVMDPLNPAARHPVLRAQDADAGSGVARARAELATLEEAQRKVESALSKEGLAGDVRTAIDERGLVVSLVSEHVVFRPDVASLSARGERVVDTLAPVLRELDEQLRIDGHTNQVQVRPRLRHRLGPLGSARGHGAAPAPRGERRTGPSPLGVGVRP